MPPTGPHLQADHPVQPVSSDVRAVAVIPARFHSSRLPGKPLLDLGGRPLIEHVYRRASEARLVSEVIVATDDERIASAVRAFGGTVRMTRPDHWSGTDRVAEVAADLTCELVVNVQGDEPLITPSAIDAAVEPFAAEATLLMTTLARVADPADLLDPHVVKVVVDRHGFALYFSRAPIPFASRAGDTGTHPPEGSGLARPNDGEAPSSRVHGLPRKHLGLYAYRRRFLLELARLAPTPLELIESLEQLRVLEHGHRIRVVDTQHDAYGVDTPEDLERVRRLMGAMARV